MAFALMPSCSQSEAFIGTERMCNFAELPEFDMRGAETPGYNETEEYFIHNISFPPQLVAFVLGKRRRH